MASMTAAREWNMKVIREAVAELREVDPQMAARIDSILAEFLPSATDEQVLSTVRNVADALHAAQDRNRG